MFAPHTGSERGRRRLPGYPRSTGTLKGSARAASFGNRWKQASTFAFMPSEANGSSLGRRAVRLPLPSRACLADAFRVRIHNRFRMGYSSQTQLCPAVRTAAGRPRRKGQSRGVYVALVLNIDVQWAGGRVVHVHCVGETYLPERGDHDAAAPVRLDFGDVGSLDSFREFLTEATRIAPDQGTVEVLGFEPDVVKIFAVLSIEGPAPDPIIVKLART